MKVLIKFTVKSKESDGYLSSVLMIVKCSICLLCQKNQKGLWFICISIKNSVSNLSCFFWHKLNQKERVSNELINHLIRAHLKRVAELIYNLSLKTVKSRVLTRLVLKYMQTFSKCLWRGFLTFMYCDLLTKSWFPN